MNKNIIAFLLILVLTSCTQVEEPTGRISSSDVGDIVKEALPQPSQKDYFARITVNEGELVKLDLDATDPDGDELEYSFSSPLNSDGEWQTEQGDAGRYPVNITVSDGQLTTERKVLLIVKGANRPPRLEPPKDIRVSEGEMIVLNLKAADPDNQELSWDYSRPFNESGEWQTEQGDNGKYQVTVEVSDGQYSDSATFFVTVSPRNDPPSLNVDTEIKVKEGEVVRLEPEVSDPDGDEVMLQFTGWMQSATYKTDFDDEGRHKVVVTATDGVHVESAVVWVLVENVNRAPRIQGLIVK